MSKGRPDSLSPARRALPKLALLPAIWLVTAGTGCVVPETPPEIGVRNGHAMVYDQRRQRVILFGGADASSVRGDTWAWDGARWSPLSSAGPGPRTFPAMAYDSIRGKVVLFGGNRVLFGKSMEENRFLQDTWEWEGTGWTQVAAAGPPARAEAAVTFDSGRGRVVVFGGYKRDGDELIRLGDTWEWDGSQWTEIKVDGPTPRNGASMVYDSARGKGVLFGGATENGVSGETWEWDGARWVEIRAALTEGRFNCVMAYDTERREVVRFGGRYAGKPVADTWEYDGEGWERRNVSGPTARNHTAIAYDSKRNRAVLFGGHDFGVHEDWVNVFGDTWEWDGGRWVEARERDPRRRVENGH